MPTFSGRKAVESEAGIDDWGFEICGYVFCVTFPGMRTKRKLIPVFALLIKYNLGPDENCI
jgi:hypothetical protein